MCKPQRAVHWCDIKGVWGVVAQRMLHCAAYSYRRNNAWEGHAAPTAAQDMMHNLQGTPLFVSEMLLLQQ